MAIEKIVVDTSKYPGTGEVLVFVATDSDLKKSDCFRLLDKKTGNKLSAKLALHDFKGKEDETVVLELNDFYTYIVIVGAGSKKEFTLITWRNALARAFKTIQSMKCKKVTLSFFDDLGEDFFEIGKELAISFHLSNYYFDVFKSREEQKKLTRLEKLVFLIQKHAAFKKVLEDGFAYGKLLTDGVTLSRDLVNQPASHLHPETLEQEAFVIEKESQGKITVEVLDEDECKRLGMGAFLGVAQGSDRKPKFIILHYKGVAKKKICLVGKSITFDSGGLSLKPSESMETMKMDMAGGATILGIFKVLANLGKADTVPEVYGILPACENMPSGKALKPGDVVTALNKKTIEVLNTDAEGRLALADGLSYAEEHIKPDILIDLATLTGACMVALGRDISGLFGNDQKLIDDVIKNAKLEGEELWPLPLYKPYAKSMKSDIADLKNITSGRYGGAITAALFLAEFVKKDHWIHIDIAGPAFNEGTPHDIIPKGGTGWGVLTIMRFLLDLTA